MLTHAHEEFSIKLSEGEHVRGFRHVDLKTGEVVKWSIKIHIKGYISTQTFTSRELYDMQIRSYSKRIPA